MYFVYLFLDPDDTTEDLLIKTQEVRFLRNVGLD